MNNKDTTIFAPVFKGSQYQGHECYSCKKRVGIGRSIYNSFKFEPSDLKFCPFCGLEIIRFSETSIFLENIDTRLLHRFRLASIIEKDYAHFCYLSMSDEEKQELKKVCEYIESDKKKLSENMYEVSLAQNAIRTKLSHQEAKKIMKNYELLRRW